MSHARHQNVFRIGIGILLLLLLLLLLRTCSSDPPARANPSLLSLLREVRDDLEWPGIDVATAAANLDSPEAALDFVRHQTLYLPYAGPFADPDAVLRTRMANSVDRSRLLAALLEEMGFETRLRLARYNETPPEPILGAAPETSSEALSQLQNRMRVPSAESEAALAAARKEFIETTARLSEEVDQALALLEKQAPQAFEGNPPKPTYRKEPQWVWVEYRASGESEWQRADPTSDKAARPATACPNPASTTLVRVVGVRGDGERLDLLTWNGEAAGRNVELLILPADRSPIELMAVKDPATIGAWIPILQIDQETIRGKAFTPEGGLLADIGGAPAVRLDADGNLDFHAPPIQKLEVAEAGSRDGKRVRARLRVTTDEMARWHAGHFRIEDEGKPARDVRLESARSEPRPVILVIDTSGSMDGRRMTIAKRAAGELIELLPPYQKLAIIQHGWNQVGVVRKPLPKREGDPIKAVNAMRSGQEQRILGSINEALRLTDEPAYVIFLTDGEDTESDNADYPQVLADTLEALRESDSIVIPVGIGEANPNLMEKIAKASGTDYIAADDPEDLPDLYAELGTLLSGSIELSYTIPEAAEPGSERAFTIRMEGFDGQAEGRYQVSDGTPFGLVRLELQVDAPPNLKATRVAADFSDGYDPWRLLSRTALWITPALYPESIVESRRVDSWIEALVMAAFLEGKPLDRAELNRSLSFDQVSTLNALRVYQQAVAGEAALPAGPALWLSTESLRREGDQILRRSRLDWPSSHDWPQVADRRELARSLLTLLAAEGLVYGDRSLNRQLLASADALATYRSEETLIPELPPSLSRLLEKPNQILIVPEDNPTVGWRIDQTTGAVYGYLADGHELAKGASVEEVAAEYRKIRTMLQLYSMLGGGGLSAVYSPAGGVFSALCAFFDQVVRLYCYSALMMNQVATAIESGEDFDVEKAEKTARDLCETSGDPDEFARDLMRETAYGFVRGTAENVVGSKIGTKLGEALGLRARTLADGALSGLTSSGTSAVNPLPADVGKSLDSLGRIGRPGSLSSPPLINAVDHTIYGAE